MTRLTQLLSLVFTSLVLLWASNLFAACDADEILVDEDADYFYCNKINKPVLENARSVHHATSRGQKPAFRSLWDYYQYNRDIAKGLAPEQNRCAIVLSMTLGLMPRADDKSLRDLGWTEDKDILTEIRKKMVIPEVAKAEIAKRYYIQAQQLANRLRSEWGEPLIVDGTKARELIAGKNGIIFLQDAYRSWFFGVRTGDHIDVWNSDQIGSDSSMPFDKAAKAWFWEIP